MGWAETLQVLTRKVPSVRLSRGWSGPGRIRWVPRWLDQVPPYLFPLRALALVGSSVQR